MTDKSHTYVGLDMGGSQTRCLVAAADGPRLRFVSCGSMPPLRWNDNDIRETQMTSKAVLEAVCEAEHEGGLTIYSAVVGVGGSQVRSNLVHTAVAVPSDRGIIDTRDVGKAIRKATGGTLGPNPAVLQLVPLEFIADRGGAVHNPIGLPARRLEAYVRVISTEATQHESTQHMVRDASIRVEETILGGFASAYATLDRSEHRGGVAHLEIGKTATSLSAYSAGRLRLASGLPIGRDHVVADVARAFSTDLGVASSLITDFGSAAADGEMNGAYVIVPTTDPAYRNQLGRPWPRNMLDKIIALRVQECMQLAYDELRHAGLYNGALRSMVISGDLAALPGIRRIARDITGLKARVGVPSQPAGLPEALRHPGWSCAAGLVLYAHRLADRQPEERETQSTLQESIPMEAAA